MCPLRRVEDDSAGPTALGLLVPPARRTFLILRPRSLDWDLVLLRRADGTQFQDMARDEAHAAAMRLFRLAQEWAAGGEGHIEEKVDPQGNGFFLQVRVGPFAFLVCWRRPGQPYLPAAFADREAARQAAGQLRPILCPPADVEQECYFNTRNFGP
jgi:hypothetical protein